MTHEEKTQTACVLRLFGMSAAAVRQAAVIPTETPEATVTPEPTDTPAPTETPEPTETQAPTDTPDPKTTEQAEKDNVQTSGKTVTASESSKSQNPLIWIAGIAVLAAIGVIIYHYKKR